MPGVAWWQHPELIVFYRQVHEQQRGAIDRHRRVGRSHRAASHEPDGLPTPMPAPKGAGVPRPPDRLTTCSPSQSSPFPTGWTDYRMPVGAHRDSNTFRPGQR
jgi:hypothetical protein